MTKRNPTHRLTSIGKRVLLLGLLLPTSACATLFASKSTNVPMNSTPSGTEVYIDGVRRGDTPTTLELNHKREYTVVFKREGHEDAVCQIDRSVGAGWIILDILGGIIPVAIDAATGAWHSLKVKNCNVNLAAVPNDPEALGMIDEIWFWSEPTPANSDSTK